MVICTNNGFGFGFLINRIIHKSSSRLSTGRFSISATYVIRAHKKDHLLGVHWYYLNNNSLALLTLAFLQGSARRLRVGHC